MGGLRATALLTGMLLCGAPDTAGAKRYGQPMRSTHLVAVKGVSNQAASCEVLQQEDWCRYRQARGGEPTL